MSGSQRRLELCCVQKGFWKEAVDGAMVVVVSDADAPIVLVFLDPVRGRGSHQPRWEALSLLTTFSYFSHHLVWP